VNDPTLRDVLLEVRALRAEVAALACPPRRPLAPADRAWLGAFLPAAGAALGDRVWTAPELAAIALRAECGPLATTLDAVGGESLRRFGKKLARCAGHAAGELELRRIGESSAGVLWQVFQTRETTRAAVAPVRVAA
jgi:hypothetical protein